VDRDYDRVGAGSVREVEVGPLGSGKTVGLGSGTREEVEEDAGAGHGEADDMSPVTGL
jgi:hypothetical protein